MTSCFHASYSMLGGWQLSVLGQHRVVRFRGKEFTSTALARLTRRRVARQLVIHLLVVLWGWGPISARAVSDPDNWSRFRGPNGTGQAGDIAFPTTWSESDYLWKVALPGIGHSSPVCWENRVWTTSGDPDTGTVTLPSLVADSGRQRWRKSFIR